MRLPTRRQLAWAGHRQIRSDGLAVCGTRVGPRPPDADTRPGCGARLLRPLRRAEHPGEAVKPVGESVGRTEREPLRASEPGAGGRLEPKRSAERLVRPIRLTE